MNWEVIIHIACGAEGYLQLIDCDSKVVHITVIIEIHFIPSLNMNKIGLVLIQAFLSPNHHSARRDYLHIISIELSCTKQ